MVPALMLIFAIAGPTGSALAAGAAVPGDINGDGTVNVADLGLLGAQWGAAGSPPFNADIAPSPSGDGIVGVGDLGVLAANWGATGGGSPPISAPLPSTGAAGLTLLGAVGLRRRRR